MRRERNQGLVVAGLLVALLTLALLNCGCASYALGRYNAVQLDRERAAAVRAVATPDGRGAALQVDVGSLLSGGASWFEGWQSAPWQGKTICGGLDLLTAIAAGWYVYSNSHDGDSGTAEAQPTRRTYIDADGRALTVTTWPDGRSTVTEGGRVQWVSDTPPAAEEAQP